MAINLFIPDKEIRGKPVDVSGDPLLGKILFEYPNGIKPLEPGPGYGMKWTPYSEIDPTSNKRDPGFIPLTVYSDTKRIYVAKYSYNYNGTLVVPTDSNDGLSPLTPKLSELEGVKLIEEGRSCHVYLRTDITHNGTVYNFSDSGTGMSQFRNALAGGEDMSKPVVITWFGTPEGKRPLVIPPIALTRSSGHSFLWWDGIHFYVKEQDPEVFGFVPGASNKLQYLNQGSSGVVIQDCEFTGAEIAIQDQVNSGMHTFIIHRCIGRPNFYRESSYNNTHRPSFSYISRIQNVTFTENVSKWAGWRPDVVGAGSNQFNHWLYFGETDSNLKVDTALVEHNIIFEPSAHAWQLRGGGTARENIAIGCSVGPSYGYMDRRDYTKGVVADGTKFTSIRNLTLKLQSMRRSPDACTGNGVCTTARFGNSNTFINPNVEHTSIGDVVAHIQDNEYDVSTSTGSQVYAVPEVDHGIRDLSPHPLYAAAMTIVDRIAYHVDEPTQGDDLNLLDPTRDLGKFFEMVTGKETTDLEAIDFLLERPKSTWDNNYSHEKIHNWIYEGYQPVTEE